MDTDKNSCANDRQLFMCVPVDTETDAGSGGHWLHIACPVLCVDGSDTEGAKWVRAHGVTTLVGSSK